MPAPSLSRSLAAIDRIGTAVMPGALRHHGIVMNAKTGEPRRRPGRVGDIRFVRIDLNGRSRNGLGPVELALDILYADFQSSTSDVLDTQMGELLRRRSSHFGMTLSSQWDTSTDMILRPLAARLDHGAVSIWAEVDHHAHEAHLARGIHPFGDIVTSEPQIRRDAIVIAGADLDQMASDAQARLEAGRARQIAERAARRRSRGRKIGLTFSIVTLLMALSIGATFLGSLLVVLLAASALAILHFSRNDHRWAAVERWLAATRDIQVARPRARTRAVSVWSEIEQAVNRHAPDRLRLVTQARASIERLTSIAETSADPILHARIASVGNGVTSLMAAYRHPACLALGEEARELTQDLSASLLGLAATADTIRTDALAAARGDFDTQRRYLEAYSEHAILSPVS